jgi:hypothetical protein
MTSRNLMLLFVYLSLMTPSDAYELVVDNRSIGKLLAASSVIRTHRLYYLCIFIIAYSHMCTSFYL